MTLNQLKYFVVTCDHSQNMTTAAKSLFVTQSAISCAIKELEEEFQVKLFTRGKKKLYLTESGEQFYQMATQVLADVERLYEAFRPSNREEAVLRIGMTALASNLFSGAMKQYQEDHPGRRLHISIFQSSKLRELIRQGGLDVAVMGWELEKGDLGEQVKVLGNNCCALYIQKDHPLSAEKEVLPDQLADLPVCYYYDSEELISGPGGPLAAEQYVPGLKLNNVQAETTFLSAVNEFVSEGKGGAILAGGIHFEDDDICQVPIQGAHPFRIAAIWKRGQLLSQETEELLTQLSLVLPEMT